MSIVAAAVFRDDESLLCARAFVPRSRSFVSSFVDTASKQVRQTGQKTGTLQLEDCYALYAFADKQLVMIVADGQANLMEANLLLELLVSNIETAADPFEALMVLDELSVGGVANQFLIRQRNVRGRLEMSSDAEAKYLEMRKLKEKEATDFRRQREAEIAKAQGTDGLLNTGMKMLGLTKPKVQQGHGIDEDELQRLRMKAQARDEPVAEPEPETESQESDEEFKIKKKVEEEVVITRQRKGRELKSKKIGQ